MRHIALRRHVSLHHAVVALVPFLTHSQCSAREVALRAEITSLEEHLGQDEDPKKFVKNHIKLLHAYNEAKDAAQLAVYKETTIKQLHEAYGLSPDD
ncbi:hypothetical protein ACEPAI_3392 [Sanghuangporus weigelae]